VAAHHDELLVILRDLCGSYVAAVDEEPMLTEAGFTAAFGADRADFRWFRGACLAYAHMATLFARALCERHTAGEIDDGELGEALVWITPAVARSTLVEWLSITAQLAPDITNRFLDAFTLDAAHLADSAVDVRDGYLPPFVLSHDHLLTSPDLIRLMLLERNLVFSLRWRAPATFHADVSKYLEPALLDEIEPWLGRLGGAVTIKREVAWAGGEFDLLVHSPDADVVLSVQAKAAIPPNGARMLAALDTRVVEGLDQHARFRGLPPDERDAVLSAALGTEVHDPAVVDLIAVRTCVGSATTWRQCEEAGVVVLTPALLRLAVLDAAVRGQELDLADLPVVLEAVLQSIETDTSASWRSDTLNFGETTLAVPTLEYDQGAIERWRLASIPEYRRIAGDDRPRPDSTND